VPLTAGGLRGRVLDDTDRRFDRRRGTTTALRQRRRNQEHDDDQDGYELHERAPLLTAADTR